MPALQAVPPGDIATLYRDHHGWLKGWLRGRVGHSEQAADLAHDTFVRLIGSGRIPTALQSRAHLVQIAKGLVIDLHRRRIVEQAWLDTLASQPEPLAASPEARYLVIETLVRLSAALDALTARVREIFLLAQLDGLIYRDIAARLGVSVATVRKAMLKATAACFDALDDGDAG
ncbi:MAG: sigma-70 family RNA polymerase sigma factor [Lautropia sp.]